MASKEKPKTDASFMELVAQKTWKTMGLVFLALLFIGTILYFSFSSGPVNGRDADVGARQEQLQREDSSANGAGITDEKNSAPMQGNVTNEDAKNQVVDAMGTSGAMVLESMDLIVLLIVLGFIIGVFMKMGGMFK